MARFVEHEHLDAIDAGRAAGATRMQAEADVLGVDHAQLGGMVARAWCLPDSLVAGIERHHATKGQAHPDSAELIGYAVHLADVVAKAVGGRVPTTTPSSRPSPGPWASSAFRPTTTTSSVRAVRARFAEVAGSASPEADRAGMRQSPRPA